MILQGKKVFVTGATRGIGRAIATAFRAGVAITLLVAGAIALVDELAVHMTDQRQVVLVLDVATRYAPVPTPCAGRSPTCW